jgi:hypothetical protein
MSVGPAFGAGFAAQNLPSVQLERTLGMPAEGPKCIPITLDFTVQDSYTLDYSNFQYRGYMSMVQTVFVDTSTSAVDVEINSPGSQQTLKIRAGTQGYYPILVPNPIKIIFTSPGGPADVKVQLLNFPVPHGQWVV